MTPRRLTLRHVAAAPCAVVAARRTQPPRLPPVTWDVCAHPGCAELALAGDALCPEHASCRDWSEVAPPPWDGAWADADALAGEAVVA